jgi:hypothetical protein
MASIASALLRSVRRSKSIPNLVVKQTCEKAAAGCPRPFPLSLKIGFELHLNTIPGVLVDDGMDQNLKPEFAKHLIL